MHGQVEGTCERSDVGRGHALHEFRTRNAMRMGREPRDPNPLMIAGEPLKLGFGLTVCRFTNLEETHQPGVIIGVANGRPFTLGGSDAPALVEFVGRLKIRLPKDSVQADRVIMLFVQLADPFGAYEVRRVADSEPRLADFGNARLVDSVGVWLQEQPDVREVLPDGSRIVRITVVSVSEGYTAAIHILRYTFSFDGSGALQAWGWREL